MVTITYPDGTVLQALLLSNEADEIRVNATRGDEASLTRVHDTWVSDQVEPVTIRFEWQAGRATSGPSDAGRICPRELADHLIWAMLGPRRRDGVDATKTTSAAPAVRCPRQRAAD
jgi:hypothetical protein